MQQKPSWVKQRRHLYQMPSWSSVKKSIIRKHLQRPAFSSHPDFTVGSGFKTDWLSLAGCTAGRDHSSRRNMSVFLSDRFKPPVCFSHLRFHFTTLAKNVQHSSWQRYPLPSLPHPARSHPRSAPVLPLPLLLMPLHSRRFFPLGCLPLS